MRSLKPVLTLVGHIQWGYCEGSAASAINIRMAKRLVLHFDIYWMKGIGEKDKSWDVVVTS